MTDPFQALAHPARRALLAELRDGAGRAGDLGAGLGVSREAVAKHLRVLVEAGLVDVERRGRERWHRLLPEGLHEVDRWLQPYRRFWEQRLDALATEVARGRRASRTEPAASAAPAPSAGSPLTDPPTPSTADDVRPARGA